MKIISWNIAGINACVKKGLIEFMLKEKADVYCFQEVKSQKELQIKGYNCYSNFAEKKGYSGVQIYTKEKPLKVIKGIGVKEFDSEGRVLLLEYSNYFLINVYFPHSSRDLHRLGFKLNFNKEFEAFCKKIEKKKSLIIIGDFNVSHKEIDLANPKQNVKNAGFTIEERNWVDSFLNKGHIDTFRLFNKDPGNYTWWPYRNNCRARNIGWRIDYFIISKSLEKHIKSSTILKDILGSDHCPIRLEI